MKNKHSQTKIELLYQWYIQQCNGHWEHDYGIMIQTIDNPGWQIKIDLHHTNMEDLTIPWNLITEDDMNWYGYKIDDKQFLGAGDPTKLEKIIDCFLNLLKKEQLH